MPTETTTYDVLTLRNLIHNYVRAMATSHSPVHYEELLDSFKRDESILTGVHRFAICLPAAVHVQPEAADLYRYLRAAWRVYCPDEAPLAETAEPTRYAPYRSLSFPRLEFMAMIPNGTVALSEATVRAAQEALQGMSTPTIADMLGGPARPPAQAIPADHFACSHCEAVVPDEQAHPRYDRDGSLCTACADSDAFVWLEGRETYAPREYVRQCRECNDFALRDNTRRVDGRWVCDSCREDSESIVYTVDDDEYHHRDNVYYHESEGCYRTYAEDDECSDCGERRNDCSCDSSDSEHESEHVYTYSKNVLNVLGNHCYVNQKEQTSIGSNLVFGVELETAERDSTSREEIAEALLKTSFGHYGICKADGTVTGPECVTLPADLESHRKLYQWGEWIKVLQPIAQGYYGDNCGMHVHINRRALSPLTVGKIQVFMNSPDNREWLTMIAQRDFASNSYCEQKAGKTLTSGRYPNDERYECVNVTRNTVEIRIFRSNLHAERLLKNIEFCHALTQWARDTAPRELSADGDGGLQGYILANRGVYPNLAKFVAAKLSIDTSEVK